MACKPKSVNYTMQKYPPAPSACHPQRHTATYIAAYTATHCIHTAHALQHTAKHTAPCRYIHPSPSVLQNVDTHMDVYAFRGVAVRGGYD